MADSPVAAFLLLVLSLGPTTAQVSPSAYYYYSPWTIPVNGSSSTGECNNLFGEITVRCNSPSSSVLFDGVIPTLTGLDGNRWATELQTTTSFTELDISFIQLDVSFTLTQGFTGVGSVEVVMFNCPAWGIHAETITVLAASGVADQRFMLGSFVITNTSCDSLVTVCIDQSTTQPIIALQFILPPDSNWVHIAEIRFSTGSCSSPSAPRVGDPGSRTVAPEIPTTTSPTTGNAVTVPCANDPSISGMVITAVVTAIITGLLTALIFLVVVMSAWKCCCTKKSATAATIEGQVYEQVDEGSQSVIRRNPTLPEPRPRPRPGNGGIPVVENAAYNNRQQVFSLEENIAYNTDAFHIQSNAAYSKKT